MVQVVPCEGRSDPEDSGALAPVWDALEDPESPLGDQEAQQSSEDVSARLEIFACEYRDHINGEQDGH